MGGEQRWRFARVIPLSSAVPVVARQPKIWIGGGPSWERAHYLWMSYNTKHRHTLTQTHMVWLSFSKATVTIWHLNTRQINWLRYLQCVCITLTTCAGTGQIPYNSPRTQYGGLQCISASYVFHMPDKNHISVGVKNCQTPCCFFLNQSYNITFIFKFFPTTKIHLFASSHLKELSGKYSEGSRDDERVKDGLCWLGWGNLAGNSEPHWNFVAFLLCRWKKERYHLTNIMS